MEEIWKNIQGYEGLYQVSNLGRIKSLEKTVTISYGTKRFQKEKILKQGKNKSGYFFVILSKDGVNKNFKVHRLVAMQFIDNHFFEKTVNHINGIKSDNNVKNLEWVSYSENMRHAYENNLINAKKNEKHYRSKISLDVAKIIKYQTIGEKASDIAKKMNLSKSVVHGIKSGRTWKNI
jgi:predicted GNAT superfamily acetyltransferase